MSSPARRSQFALLLILVGVAAIAAAALLLVSTDPAEAPGPATAAGTIMAPGEAPRIELEEAKTAYDAGSAVFVDVRPAASYAASHIPGALSIPLDDLEARKDELHPAAPIITYCT
jgi:3-mercaptopyruvate sulfurtransferase SseA